jgi:hypothetical protein
MSAKQFAINFSAFLLLLAIAPFLVQNYFGAYLITNFWTLFFIFGSFSLILLPTALWQMNISVKSSGQALLATTVLRFIFGLVVLLIYLLNFNVIAGIFMLNFFYLYFAHMGFEIYCLLCNLRT